MRDPQDMSREELVEEVRRLHKLLREVEWVHDSEYGMAFCPVCIAVRPNHQSGCAMAAALVDAGKDGR